MSADVTEFIGIYDADSTVIGEVSYWIGARLGRRHCSLCDITHGLFAKRAEWEKCVDQLPVPFHTYHRNDAPDDVRQYAEGRYPCVIARHGTILRTVLEASELAQLEGSASELAHHLHRYLD